MELSRQELSIGTLLVNKFLILHYGHILGKRGQKIKKKLLCYMVKYGHQSKALNETISIICFLFVKKQVKIQFLRKNEFLGFQT